jgi:hypothetical protein
LDHEILDIDRNDRFFGLSLIKPLGFSYFTASVLTVKFHMIAAYQLALEKARKANPNVELTLPKIYSYARMQP